MPERDSTWKLLNKAVLKDTKYKFLGEGEGEEGGISKKKKVSQNQPSLQVKNAKKVIKKIP